MSPAELLAHPLSQAATWTLLHFVWQGLLIAAALVAVVELLRLRRPTDRYVCSLTALLLMAACPLATLAWQGFRVQGSGLGDRRQGTELALQSAIRNPQSAIAQPAPADLILAAQPYVLAAWLSGVALLGGRLLLGFVGLRRLRNSRLPLPPELARHAEQLSRRLAMGRRTLVFLSERVGEAIAVGFVRPIVLIPAAWATEMPLAMLEAVIAHELAHLRRQDLWINLLQRVVETLLFYHPAVWWLSRRLRTERELCCDELAVAATGQRLLYVQALENVARRRVARVQPVLAAGIRGERNMRLLERVRNVLGLSATADRSRLWPAGLLVLALPLGAWAWSAGLIVDPVSAVADDDRDDREDDDDDDDDDREEGRKDDREDDDDDDEKEGREKKDADDDDEKEGAKDKEREDDNDGEKKEARKEGDRDRDEGERKEPARKDPVKREVRIEIRREEVRRDGDNPEAARLKRERIEELKFFGKEGEARKDGDRPVKEGARDGDRPVKEGPRDGEVRKPGPRDGEARKEGPRDGDVRKPGPRDGDKPVKEGERKIVRDGDKPAKDMEAYVSELTALVKKLQVENERLRAELAGRGEKRKEGADELYDKEAAARKKEAAARERDANRRAAESDYKRAAGEKEEAIRRAIKAKELDADREAAERKEAERKELEARERKIKDAALRDREFAAGAEKDARAIKDKEAAAAREKEAAADKEKEDR